VLAKACEKMQPTSAADVAEASAEDDNANSAAKPDADEAETTERPQSESFSESQPAEDSDPELAADDGTEEPQHRSHSVSFAGVCAVALLLASAFCLWRARDTIVYLSRTPEGKMQVLRESVAALFYQNPSAALPVGSVVDDTHDDAYFSRVPAGSEAQTAALQVVATESTLSDAHMPLSKAADLPLPVPVLAAQEAAPVRVERAAIPQSMRDSPPIAPPVVVTVSPAQMMPISAPQPQSIPQPTSEPVTVSEDAARALLVHTVNPVYPPEALAQKLHGAVVLQALVGRDGSVEDLKIVRGYFVLGRAAIAAVKQWRFQPYTLDGHAASTQTLITINFTYPPG
jgi:TonB family protein